MTTARTYIVTGGGGGIGSATVLRLLRAGSNVLAVDISRRKLEAVATAAKGLPGSLLTLIVDITDEEGTKAMVAHCIEAFGSLHGIANVAGGIVGITQAHIDRPLAEITLHDFRADHRLNVESVFLTSKATYPHFRDQHYGKIVNVSSVAAFANRPDLGNAAYDPAKAAVIGLTHSLSRSLGKDGIRVNAIAPGLVMGERVAEAMGQDWIDRLMLATPLGEFASADDAAELIGFLLEPQSDRISGEVIRISGGLR